MAKKNNNHVVKEPKAEPKQAVPTESPFTPVDEPKLVKTEKAEDEKKKVPTLYMFHSNGESLAVTTTQWETYGQKLLAAGWLRPSWATSDGGDKTIPASVVWGKD